MAFALVLAASACSSGPGAASGDQGVLNIGLVVSLTGIYSATAGLELQGATVALAKANADHLAGNSQLRFVRVDDGSSPDTARRACSQLVGQDHVAAIVGFESAIALDACNRAAMAKQIPYFAGVPSGSDVCYSNVFVFGFTPNQQVTPLIEYLAHRQAARTFYVVATDSRLARGSVGLAALRIRESGGVLLGTIYRPLKTVDFRSDIAKIAAAKPDVVLDGLVGNALTIYHRQFQTDPRTARVKQASLWLNTATAQAIGPQAVGIFVAQDYNSSDGSSATQAWLAALMKKYGDGAFPSASGAEIYDATLFMAEAVGHAQSTSGAAIASAAGAVSIVGPRGPVKLASGSSGYATVSAHIGRVNARYAIDQVDVIGPVDPLACLGG